MLIFALAASQIASAQGSLLRVDCDDDNGGAEVSVNGQFKGECPLDMRVQAGAVKLEAVKKVDAQRERTFVQEFRIGDAVTKHIDIVLGPVQLNADGRRIEAERQRLAQEARDRAEQQRLVAASAAAQAKQQRIDEALNEFRAQGAEPGNGRGARECADCPEMVLVPGGADRPPLAVGKYEVTVGEYTAFARASAQAPGRSCVIWQGGWLTNLAELWKLHPELNWENPGYAQTPRHPVVCVSLNDANAYARWLSEKTGHAYAVPTTEEWARANGQTVATISKPWKPQENSNHPACRFGNFYDKSADSELSTGLGKPFDCKDGFVYAAPVGSFPANSLGIHDLWGNVAELDAKVELTKVGNADFRYATALGLSWSASGEYATGNYASIDTYMDVNSGRRQNIGFRVVRRIEELAPGAAAKAAAQAAAKAAPPASVAPFEQAERLAMLTPSPLRLMQPPAPSEVPPAVGESDALANVLYEQAANAGHPLAMLRLAERYETGLGAPKDGAKAFQLYWKAAQAGLPAGMGGLASMFYVGMGTAKDLVQMLTWARQGADAGDARAMNALGLLYESGVPGQLSVNAAQGLSWIQRAAEAGDPRALTNLATHYARAQGLPKDEAAAARLYMRAASMGWPAAMSTVGSIYQNGAYGTPQNLRAATLWLGRAALAGDTRAMLNLGGNYERGLGVEKDLDLALAWYNKAAALGDELARKFLEQRKAELAKAQGH
ncbi:SUMF1/EgtB/PvdO family nonheme iron enzyme [Burkholderiaceae bacterium UC74_6]